MAKKLIYPNDPEDQTDGTYGANPTDAKTTTETYTVPRDQYTAELTDEDIENGTGKVAGAYVPKSDEETRGSDGLTDIDRAYGVTRGQYQQFNEKEPDPYTANMKMMEQYLPHQISEEEQKRRARTASALQGLQAFSNGLSALAGLYSTGGGGYAMQIPQADTQSVHKWLNEQDAKRTQNAQLLAQASGRDEAAYQQARANWLARKQAVDQYNQGIEAEYRRSHNAATLEDAKAKQSAQAQKEKEEADLLKQKNQQEFTKSENAKNRANASAMNDADNATQLRVASMRKSSDSKDSEESLNRQYQGHRKADPKSVDDWAKANHIRVARSGMTAEQKRDYNAWCEKNGRGTYKKRTTSGSHQSHGSGKTQAKTSTGNGAQRGSDGKFHWKKK